MTADTLKPVNHDILMWSKIRLGDCRMERQAINYEVAVSNIAVRDAMKKDERHPFIKDDRADIHWIEVRAYTPAAAR